MRLNQLNLLGLLAFMLLLSGCASSVQETTAHQESAGPPAEGDAPMKRPFMFREAKLPEGFPPPGPVGEIIVKDYPAYRLARVRAGEEGVAGDTNAMFRPLFKHIKRNDIAMTAPVEIGYGDQSEAAAEADESAASMAFLYGEPSWGRQGVDKDDPRVVVEDVPAMTVASIGVRGGYTDANLDKALNKLNEWVEARRNRVRVVGPPRYLAYNSPFVLGFLKYGEVQLPIERLD